MKKFSTLFVLLCVLLIASNFFIVSCPDDDDDPTPTPTPTPTMTPTPEPDIIPGEKMYNLYIGEPFETCSSQYGPPDDHTCTQGICMAIYFDPYLFIGLIDSNNNTELDDSDIIDAIGIFVNTNWYGTTAGGNGIGSSRESIISEFGPCEAGDVDFCHYLSLGISWYFFTTTDCDSILVQSTVGANFELINQQFVNNTLNMLNE